MSILEEGITTLNADAPRNKMSKDVRQKLIELHRKIVKSTIITGDLCNWQTEQAENQTENPIDQPAFTDSTSANIRIHILSKFTKTCTRKDQIPIFKTEIIQGTL